MSHLASPSTPDNIQGGSSPFLTPLVPIRECTGRKATPYNAFSTPLDKENATPTACTPTISSPPKTPYAKSLLTDGVLDDNPPTPTLTSPPRTPYARGGVEASPMETPRLESPPKTPFARQLLSHLESPCPATPSLPSPPKTPFARHLFTWEEKSKKRDDKEGTPEGLPILRDLNLNDFPSSFRAGVGATQLNQVYSVFSDVYEDQEGIVQLGEEDVLMRFPELGDEKVELLLELLVTKGYLSSRMAGLRLVWECRKAEANIDKESE